MRITKEWKGEKSPWMFVRDRQSDSFVDRLMATEGTEYKYRVPDTLENGWDCGDFKNAGIESATIIRLMKEIIAGKHGDIHSIVVARGGKLVLEEYFALSGSLFGPFVTETYRDKVHHLASVTKGVTSALVGIAINNGMIEDVEKPVFSFMPEYAHLSTDDKSRIELRHLLTMTAGLEWQQFRYPFSDPRNDGG
jgi:CubicO group peptidase (beta-lactamase class C family)